MQNKYKDVIICGVLITVISLILITALHGMTEYKTETEIITDAYIQNGFGSPVFNENTRHFEWISPQNNYYIGFTSFNDWDTNTLMIYEFKNGSIAQLGQKFVYTAENNDYQVIYSETIERRFK